MKFLLVNRLKKFIFLSKSQVEKVVSACSYCVDLHLPLWNYQRLCIRACVSVHQRLQQLFSAEASSAHSWYCCSLNPPTLTLFSVFSTSFVSLCFTLCLQITLWVVGRWNIGGFLLAHLSGIGKLLGYVARISDGRILHLFTYSALQSI